MEGKARIKRDKHAGNVRKSARRQCGGTSSVLFWFFTETLGKSSLGARLRTRKVTGRDASLPAPLLSAFGILVARGTVGALPQTPQGTLSLDPARGNCPLTPPRD